MTFLDEHLGRIYLSENVEKGISQVKSKVPAVADAMESGNLFKVRSLLNTLPDASLDELMNVAQRAKGFKKHSLESKRMVKGDKTEMQKYFIVLRSTLKSLGESTKPSFVSGILNELDVFARKYAGPLTSAGSTITTIMFMIRILFQHTPTITRALMTGYKVGAVIFLVGILLYLVRIILNMYFKLKGTR